MMKEMWSVSSLVAYIKRGIDHDENLMQLLVQGEISNLVKHRSGHYYFTLKDDKARMSCVMFSNYARLVHFNLENGSRVIARCKVSVYEASGSVQLYVNGLQLDGIGDLYLQFEALKKKLMNEGLFEITHKKELPEYPMDIALISAKEAAAKSDVKTTLARRWPLAKLTFYPSLVQGNEASRMLIETIQHADQNHHDLILLVRGGGSLEDLWAFNNEKLARCIYHAQTPIITGVGHETDTTLVDYVSDARAATPTAAAQLATPDIQEVIKLLAQKKTSMLLKMKAHAERAAQQLERRKHHPLIKDPLFFIENNVMTLDIKRSMFEQQLTAMMSYQSRIDQKKQDFYHQMQLLLERKEYHLKSQTQHLITKGQTRYQLEKHAYQKRIELLDAFSPLKILMRGYSLTKCDERYVRSVDEVNEDDHITTRLKDGLLISKVIKKEKKDE